MPKYTMHLTEAKWCPPDKHTKTGRIRTAVWIIVLIIMIASFIFKENIFMELSWTARILLISLCINLPLFWHEKKPFEMELYFYDDKLILYREKTYCVLSIYRKETYIIPYSGIKELVYRSETKRFNILGIIEGICYNYKKNGSLPEKPNYHKTTDSIEYFYTDFLDVDEVIKAFETYSNINVAIHDT